MDKLTDKDYAVIVGALTIVGTLSGMVDGKDYKRKQIIALQDKILRIRKQEGKK